MLTNWFPSPRTWRARVAWGLAAAALATATVGCDRAPGDDTIKEWTPSDHDRMEENARTRAAQAAPPRDRATTRGDAGAQSDQALVEMTWRQRCAVCHGAEGHGDGPNGPMVKAPDLTRADWQGQVSDAEIAATIQNGKNLMPKFDLPPKVVAGLIARIRASKGE